MARRHRLPLNLADPVSPRPVRPRVVGQPNIPSSGVTTTRPMQRDPGPLPPDLRGLAVVQDILLARPGARSNNLSTGQVLLASLSQS